MAAQTKVHQLAARVQALAMLQQGDEVGAIAAAVGVTEGTIRRWRQQWDALGEFTSSAPVAQNMSVTAMLRREAPAVARVLLDQAKEGDVRAATLVVRLLGNTLAAEAREGGADGTAAADITRELEHLPPAVAYEIVGLLAQVGRAPTGSDPAADTPPDAAAVGPLRVPWEEGDPSPDAGEDEL
jgi:transposase-like protein